MDYMSKADMLYQDVENYQNNIESIMQEEDASPSDIAAALDFQKDSLKDEIVKCYKTRSNYQYAADAIKAELDVLNSRVKALKDRAADFELKAQTIDEVIKVAMTTMGECSIFTPMVTIEMKVSPQKVEIDDEDAVPDEFRVEAKRPAPSKTLLKPYLEAHPECEFAHLEKSMDIKYKVD